ncbi:MAG TPA: serpin family protein, partial [Verrucomicrobiae bacterium]|nr:serpin family protein [Verrucomicrobiae bacterium]
MPRRLGTWKARFFLGLGFEIVLATLVLVLPRDSRPGAYTFNFLVVSHFVPIALLTGIDTAPAVALLFGFTAVVGLMMVWGALLDWGCRQASTAWKRLGYGPRSGKWAAGVLALVALAAIGFAMADATQDSPRSFALTTELQAAVDGNNAFALELYRKLADRPGNVFFSPSSLSSAMGMVYAGARGRTAQEIAATAHLPTKPEQSAKALGEWRRRCGQVERRWGKVQLRVANSLWVQDSKTPRAEFVELLRSEYRAEARRVDFKKSADSAAAQINAWARQQTGGRFAQIADPKQLDSRTRLFLCNAIYFKARWASRFKEKDTRSRPFSITGAKTVSVPTMTQKAYFKTIRLEDANATLLELPYYGRDLSMVIILPDDVEGLGELERELAPAELKSWCNKLAQAEPRETVVALPRFSTAQTIPLKQALVSLGMQAAFCEGDSKGNGADLSGIDGTQNLYLSQAVQQAVVEVNESGTEATAINWVVARAKSMPNRFIVDRPFLFMIHDNATDALLFMGRIVDPSTTLQ